LSYFNEKIKKCINCIKWMPKTLKFKDVYKRKFTKSLNFQLNNL